MAIEDITMRLRALGLDLIDIGSNLTHDSFAADRDAVMARALEAGRAAAGGHRRRSGQLACRRRLWRPLIPAYLWSTAGVHPHHAQSFDGSQRAELHDLLRLNRSGRGRRMRPGLFPQFLAAGGAAGGLHRAAGNRRRRSANRCSCINATRTTTSRPFSRIFAAICTAAWRIVSPAGDASWRITWRWIFTSGSRAGCTMSAAAASCGKRFRAFPADRLMLETDAPYLLPRDLMPRPKSRRNEPCFPAAYRRARSRDLRGETPGERGRRPRDAQCLLRRCSRL